jgi:tellurite resistance protein TehA-like permease
LFKGWITPGIRDLYPGYFALVMATGIISNAFRVNEYGTLSNLLLAVNLVAFPLLLTYTVIRVMRFPREIFGNLTDPRVVFAFFTLVAASDVLGVQLLLRGQQTVAIGLWIFALILWIFLSYFSFLTLIFRGSEFGVDVVHGGWLIAIVGTESLVLLGTQIAPHLGSLHDSVALTVHALWGIGIVLYGIFVTLFSYRIFFKPVDVKDMDPLFWVVMGAAAIASNAGSIMLANDPGLEFLTVMQPFVEGATLILWAWATWLIPLFVGLGFWRHFVKHQPFEYSPKYWSLVFPLGMYSVATMRLSYVSDFTPIERFSAVMVWVAAFAWSLVMIGLLRHLVRGARAARAAT